LDVFGTTITVAHLQNGPNGAGWIANSSGSAPGTLVVGTDGSSTTFDGVFGNGGSQPLHLTKVGAGTLTLTAPATNTGVVTVNGGTLALSGAGSFANATRLVANGTLDVTGIGGTLSLTGGQTLAGQGTVAGAVHAPAGSIVSPGASVGTLTVTGNIHLAGTLLLELNRTNTPSNCDTLVSSGGSITYGGLLVVTNIGPALQAGDTFHLFPTAVSGFAGVTLATTDATGNVYTWTNRIGSNGSIQVLSVTPPAPPVNPNPTNLLVSVSGSNLTLSWPASHTGWSLQAQTNSLGIGLSTNWVTLGYETTNQVTLPVHPANPAVFYRLRYTLP
jgi:autotransporter-associated beta strand protein